MPWEAVRRVQEDHFRVNLVSTRLKQAPRIQTDRIGDLNNRDYGKDIYEYYQVDSRRTKDNSGNPGDGMR